MILLTKRIRWLLGRLALDTAWIFFRYFCKGKIVNLDKLPQAPYIIAANHVSYFDWLVLHSAFRKLLKIDVIFIAKKRLFNSGYLKIIVEYAKCINVDQENITSSFIKSAVNVTKEKKVLGIFPEGKRSENGKLVKAYPGAVRIAQITSVPIVPIGLNGFFDILPKGKKIPRIKKCSIVIGDSLIFKKKSKDEKNCINKEDDTRLLMMKIAELTNQKYNY